MRWNLTGGYLHYNKTTRQLSSHSENIFRPLIKYYFGHAAGTCKCGWAQNGQRTELGEPGRMQVLKTWWCNAHDDMIWDAWHTSKWQGNNSEITGGHLAHRSRGATTLHHYERISSRDLEWHQRENGREREEVKLSCFFDKREKPKNLEKVKPFSRK